jgi:hypothetical protein
MKNKEKELPKWFTDQGGVCYKEGDKVTNYLSNSAIHLTNTELSMYDYIKGCELIAQQTGNTVTIKNLSKSLAWFRSANPEAYMVLLD